MKNKRINQRLKKEKRVEQLIKEDTINDSSKHEVQELLSDYVVSPLNEDMKKLLEDIIKSVEELSSKTKKNFESLQTNLNEILDKSLDKTKEKLLEEFEEKVEDIEEGIKKNINENINNTSQDILDKTKELSDKTKNNFSSLQGNLNGSLDRTKEKLLEEFEEKVEGINENINNTSQDILSEIQSNKNGIEEKINTMQNTIDLKLTSATKKLEQNTNNAISLINDTSQKHNEQLIELKNLIDTVEKNRQEESLKLQNDFNKQNEGLNNKIEEFQSLIIDTINKKLKRQFIVSLSLGIASILGLIVIILR